MSANAWKWLIALGLGALGGLIDVATDAKFPGWWDIVRHVLLGMGTTATALRMTLTPNGKQ